MKSTRMPLGALALLAAGCGGPDNGFEWTAQPDATVVLVVPNVDDDDENGTVDFLDAPRADDDDRARLAVSSKKKRGRIAFEGDISTIRVYADGELVLGGEIGAEGKLPSRDGKEPIEVEIEVSTSGSVGVLTLGDQQISVAGVPPTMGHHLLPTQRVWVSRINFGAFGYSNVSMVTELQATLGDKLTVIPAESLEYPDVWVQDEFESFGYWTPDAESQMALNLPRDGGLDTFVDGLLSAGLGERSVGRPNDAMSADSGGNIEVTPPITVDGVEYPLGRIYYGNYTETYFGQTYTAPQEPLKTFLHDTGAQEPIELDTSWLCVGHVDEFVTFLPDPSAPRGFRMFYADIPAGKALLESMPGDLALSRYALEYPEGHGYANPAAILGDATLMAFNDDVQRDSLDVELAKLVAELDLVEEEIVRVPSLFLEEVYEEGVCGALSLIPGTVNLLMVTDDEGTGGTAVLPDPYLRTAGSPEGDDPLVTWWKDNLPSGVTPVFVDDWDVYHMAQGEVHCGTNQLRDPALSHVDDLAPWTSPAVEAL